MSASAIDLRSDTATRPTSAMRAFMAAAEVGDDVSGEDPSINRLQERIAALLGKEAALFVPSGTMSNQIGVRLHCVPGDEIILEETAHIYAYEQGGVAQLSGCATRTVRGEYGIFGLDQIRDMIRPDNAHYPRTRLLCIENTSNRGGGTVWPLERVEELCDWAHGQGLATHLDGARLFNAVVATGIAADRWAAHFDTVSVCFSKGLGAPVGSAICGPRKLIDKALRVRKVFGGGMRQGGIIASGALYALDNNIDRLADDHGNARRFAELIRNVEGIKLDPPKIETNIVFFHVDPRLGTAADFAGRLKRAGLLVGALAKQTIRAVTHLDVTTADIEQAAAILKTTAAEVLDAARPIAKAGGAYA
ncbi:MAG: aminotransferase class I/II-fold pyridoxal phosphate-dependent enzyme [Planctomycetia bacterium]|nr:aminotransferase class I/II-fold pyridoxal phosphate-dependent enzyme [Planctomycetia bacterium]